MTHERRGIGRGERRARLLGGRWTIASAARPIPEAGFASQRLLRVGVVTTSTVDEWIDVARFYPPDCVLYTRTKKTSLFAACGDRAPVAVGDGFYQMDA